MADPDPPTFECVIPPIRRLLLVIVALSVCCSALTAGAASAGTAASAAGRTAGTAQVSTHPATGSHVGLRAGVPTARTASRPSRRALRLSHRVLVRVNRLRRSGMRCSGVWQPRVTPVRHNARLAMAARIYARRMAVLRFFSHVDRVTGATPGLRATGVGYHWATVGENLAAGYATPAAVIRAWRTSPSHCRNMMDGRWRHLGVGWFYGAKSRWGSYWSQLFGAPLADQ